MDALFPVDGPAKSPLARYRLLSPTASIRVSPICLGTMNFGEAWTSWMGSCDQTTAENILDCYFDQGGNFIDTAVGYQDGDSEKWIGQWMKRRQNRDQMVIATKYSCMYKASSDWPSIKANIVGNGTKCLRTSVVESLRRLQTDYIDLLYVHLWDYSASIPELMQSLNQLVLSGKVLYLGISDTPAWAVSKANEYARNHGLRQFSVYQGLWSAAVRDFERDIIPMCKAGGMGICPWGSLGGGKFKTEAERQSGEGRAMLMGGRTEADIKVINALEIIAKRKNTALVSIALAYVMHKTTYVFPIVGGRKLEQLRSNIEALAIELSTEDIQAIEAATPFDLGFPHSFLWAGGSADNPQDVGWLNMAAIFDYVEDAIPIKPKKAGN